MKTLVAILLACLCLVAFDQCHAESFFHAEVGLGEGYAQTQGDTLWYQQRFSHSLRLSSAVAEIGVTGNIVQHSRWGIDWHLDYAWLGHSSSTAWAVPDANYNANSPNGCNGACYPLSRFDGHGNVQGVYLSIEPHYDVNQWRFGIEAGPLFYFPTWTENVYVYNGDILHVHNHTGLHFGYMVGVSVSRGPWTLAYQLFRDRTDPGKDLYPPIWSFTHVLVMKYRF